jgi:hypothetical protein
MCYNSGPIYRHTHTDIYIYVANDVIFFLEKTSVDGSRMDLDVDLTNLNGAIQPTITGTEIRKVMTTHCDLQVPYSQASLMISL